MFLGQIINKYRMENGLTLQAFADKCKLSKGYIAMLEKNYNSKTKEPIVPSATTFCKVADAMNISLESLLSEVDENQPIGIINIAELANGDLVENHSSSSIAGVRIPVLGEIVAGLPIDAYQEILDYEEIPAALASQGEFFALKVKGDSMSPRIADGDVVICKQQSDIESGDIAVVTINGDTATLKKVIKHSTGITLVALNAAVFQPQFFTNEEVISLPITIQGKVIELRAKF